jgi:hypothetical protein
LEERLVSLRDHAEIARILREYPQRELIRRRGLDSFTDPGCVRVLVRDVVSWRRPWEGGRSPVGVLVGQDAVGELAELDQFVVVQPGEESMLEAPVVGLLRLP